MYNFIYIDFAVLLGAASQRIEYLALEFIGTPWFLEILERWKRHERGAFPGPTECGIMFYIISMLLGIFRVIYSVFVFCYMVYRFGVG